MNRYKRKFDDITVIFTEKHSNPIENIGVTTVDKSQFHPSINEVRNFISSGAKSQRDLVYDFQDGKDTGLRLTQLRDKGADRTEIAEIQSILSKSVKNDTEKINKKIKEELQKNSAKLDEVKTSEVNAVQQAIK